MKIILTFSLGGNILFILYSFTNKFLMDNINIKWNYFMLKIAIVISLIPFGCIKELFLYLANRYSFIPVSQIFNNYQSKELILISTPEGTYINCLFQFELFVVLVWGLIAIAFSFKWYLNYSQFKRQLITASEMIAEDKIQIYIKKYYSELPINKNIHYFYIRGNNEAFTTGIKKPLVILSENFLEGEKELELKHELVHIKNNDMLWNVLSRLVICLNWFNPLAYLLVNELERFTELNCDYEVAKDLDKEEKKKYGYMIIDSIKENRKKSNFLSAFNNQKLAKERIYYIMSYSKKKVGIFSIFLTICMVLISSFSAFAYQSVQRLEIGGNISTDDLYILNNPGSFISFSDKPFNSDTIAAEDYENYFISENGKVYDTYSANEEPYANCEHSFTNGEYVSHAKQQDGSCIMKYYNAKRCIKCGYILVEDLINIVTYQKCPH